jgi:hypothetical protein
LSFTTYDFRQINKNSNDNRGSEKVFNKLGVKDLRLRLTAEYYIKHTRIEGNNRIGSFYVILDAEIG